MLTKTQKRVCLVLDRIKAQVEAEHEDAVMFAESLDAMLGNIALEDGFGTEGATDPRGDFRDGDWDVRTRVQGVDK